MPTSHDSHFELREALQGGHIDLAGTTGIENDARVHFGLATRTLVGEPLEGFFQETC